MLTIHHHLFGCDSSFAKYENLKYLSLDDSVVYLYGQGPVEVVTDFWLSIAVVVGIIFSMTHTRIYIMNGRPKRW